MTIDESVQSHFKTSFQRGLEAQCKIGAKDVRITSFCSINDELVEVRLPLLL